MASVRGYGTPQNYWDMFYMMHTLSGWHHHRRTECIQTKSQTRDQHNHYCTTYTVGFISAYSIHQTQLTIINWVILFTAPSTTFLPSISRRTAIRLVGVGRARIPSRALAFEHLICHLFFFFFRARGMWYNPHSESVRLCTVNESTDTCVVDSRDMVCFPFTENVLQIGWRPVQRNQFSSGKLMYGVSICASENKIKFQLADR